MSLYTLIFFYIVGYATWYSQTFEFLKYGISIYGKMYLFHINKCFLIKNFINLKKYVTLNAQA